MLQYIGFILLSISEIKFILNLVKNKNIFLDILRFDNNNLTLKLHALLTII